VEGVTSTTTTGRPSSVARWVGSCVVCSAECERFDSGRWSLEHGANQR
jgi:hypothetical protein